MTTKTPIALCIFNRPHTTRRVFEAIRQAQPETLFVIADGPRADADVILCKETRAVIDVDWDCDFYTIYSQHNKGVGRNYPDGLTRVFEMVGSVIALEDDVLPHPSFFPFVDAMIERYADDERVGVISGSRNSAVDTPQTYTFERAVWHQGVAFWKRTWETYEPRCQSWGESPTPRNILRQRMRGAELEGYIAAVERAYHDPDNEAYDYKLSYAWTSRGQWGIVPKVNLVSNIGFGPGATHTPDANHPLANRDTFDIGTPDTFIHPETVPDLVTYDPTLA